MRAKIPLRKKLDLHYYLSFWVVPFIVLFSFLLLFLHLSGVIAIRNSFNLAFLLANSFSFVPMMVLGLVSAKKPVHKIAYLVPLAVLYAYHWVPVLIFGWASILAGRKPYWVKTERYAVQEVLE